MSSLSFCGIKHIVEHAIKKAALMWFIDVKKASVTCNHIKLCHLKGTFPVTVPWGHSGIVLLGQRAIHGEMTRTQPR